MTTDEELSAPPWWRPFPDATTETILRIDAELNATQIRQERLRRDCVCLLCNQPGIHVHAKGQIPPAASTPGL